MTDQVPLPTADTEFVIADVHTAPAWVDKNCIGYDNGPCLRLPVDLSGGSPYTTIAAHVGDTVKFIAAKGGVPAHFEVVPAEPDPAEAKERQAQVTNASLEDQLKGETITAADLDDDAKAQVALRSPAVAAQFGITEPAAPAPATE